MDGVVARHPEFPRVGIEMDGGPLRDRIWDAGMEAGERLSGALDLVIVDP